MRFRLFESYKNLVIEVLSNGEHVAASPYRLEGTFSLHIFKVIYCFQFKNLTGMVYHEQCYCPQSSVDVWLKNMNCPSSIRQIKLDLSIFNDIDMESVAADLVSRFNIRGSHSLCHYVIKENQVKSMVLCSDAVQCCH